MSFAKFFLASLCAYAFTVPAYGFDTPNTRNHYNRVQDLLHQNHPRLSHKGYYEPKDCDDYDYENSLEKNPHLLSGLLKIMSSRPCMNGFSVSRLARTIEKYTNSEFRLDMGFLPQWFHPKRSFGSQKELSYPLWQFFVAPSASWLFYDSEVGQGRFTFSFTTVQYWRNRAETVNNALGLAGGVNAIKSSCSNFNELTFSHTFPGDYLTLCLGQYSLYNLDGNRLNNNQLTHFLSYPLTQNASAGYSLGSLGYYVQVTPNSQLMMQVGMQDAYNVKGDRLSFYNLTKNRYSFHGLVSWAPQCCLGSGLYSCVVYSARPVPDQPTYVTGWSVNMQQDIKKVSVFGRYNGATGTAQPIHRSYVAGFVSQNPLNRHKEDMIGAAYAINRINANAVEGTVVHKYEAVAEAFLSVGFGPYLTLTPDIQVHRHPAFRQDKDYARVYSLRARVSI